MASVSGVILLLEFATNISELTDVSSEHRRQDASVQIVITLDTNEPPTGTLQTDDSPPRRFVGWLDLLHAVAEVSGSSRTLTSPGGVSGQLDSRRDTELRQDV
jgi:hypothetical protein